MKRIRLAAGFSVLAVGTLLLSGTIRSSAAQDQQSYAHHGAGRSEDKGQTGAFVKAVREATERFRDVAVAQSEGYALMFGCVSGPDAGAMGLHYVNLALVGDGELDATRPEIVIYEPLPNGRLRLTGADYLVFSSDWHAKNVATPELGGQLLHLFESPNRFGLPAFYTLHVWAWKDNPAGAFSNWHPNVSCASYGGQ
jgi:hypothetical protein